MTDKKPKNLKEKANDTVKKDDEIKALKKKLTAEFPNLWDTSSQDDQEAAFSFAEEYKTFLDLGKTEREFVTVAVETLESLGYEPLGTQAVLKPGDKVYKSIHGKGLVAAVVGSQPATDGFNLLGAHIDSPRLDLKPNPFYEDSDLTFLKTHYYGGIKKYQWAAIPSSATRSISCVLICISILAPSGPITVVCKD